MEHSNKTLPVLLVVHNVEHVQKYLLIVQVVTLMDYYYFITKIIKLLVAYHNAHPIMLLS